MVFVRARVVVFCDGDFWHGRDWPARRERLARGANAGYWTAKIESNVLHDRRMNEALRLAGWRVLRLWETDVTRDPEGSALMVRAFVASERPSQRLRRAVGRSES